MEIKYHPLKFHVSGFMCVYFTIFYIKIMLDVMKTIIGILNMSTLTNVQLYAMLVLTVLLFIICYMAWWLFNKTWEYHSLQIDAFKKVIQNET